MELTKVCGVCQNELPATTEYFYIHKKGKNNLHSYCKVCSNKKCKDYYEKNKQKLLNKVKNYRKNNKEKIHKQNKTWRNRNKTKILEKNKIYTKQRRKEDIGFKMLLNIRSRIGNAIKRNKKHDKTIGLLGCSIIELKKHLESKFDDKMNWENYGRNGWHIDHILPCSSFDLTDPEQQKKCFHYTNLQPLWAKENMKKGDKVPYNA